MEGSGRAEDDTDKNRSRAGGAGYTDADKWGQHVTTDQKSMSVRTLEISKDKDKIYLGHWRFCPRFHV